LLDANERVEDSHPPSDVEPELLRMGRGIEFGIESLNREGKAHRANQQSVFRTLRKNHFPLANFEELKV
jgi:hypothetical protein